MRFCLNCRQFSGGGPMCTRCGRSFGGRLCKGRTRHLNPYDALFCNYCGTSELTEGAISVPLGWVTRLLLLGGVYLAVRWLWLGLATRHGLIVESVTGYRDVRIWIIERLANLLIILFVFYFLSAFIPGDAGKQFRDLLMKTVHSSIKLLFKMAEESLHLLGRLLLHLIGIEPKAKNKQK